MGINNFSFNSLNYSNTIEKTICNNYINECVIKCNNIISNNEIIIYLFVILILFLIFRLYVEKEK